MRNLFIFFFSLIIFSLFSGCNHSNRFEPKKIIITGKVTGFDIKLHERTIQLIYHDIIEEYPITKTVEISAEGLFKYEFDRSFPQEVYLVYGTLIPIYLSPGDSLFFTIHPKTQNKTDDNEVKLSSLDQLITANPLNNENFNLKKFMLIHCRRIQGNLKMLFAILCLLWNSILKLG